MLIILAQLGGNLVSLVNLPPLLGMIIVGVILRSVPYVNIIGSNIDHSWSSTIRKIALVIILTRAGLGLDPNALKKLSFTVIRMGILPNLVEMSVVAVVSHYLLNFPWLWGFMLGFIFSGVSPSVVVPCMLNLSDRQLGTDKGVPTLVIAGLSIDNALSISGFGVFLGIIFSEGSVWWQACKGPVEVIVGIGWGVFMGTFCWGIPNRFEKGYAKFRFFFLFAAGLLSVFGSQKLNFGGAGAMGCLTAAFVAGIGWRNQGWSDQKHPVKKNFNFLWSFFQPLLFGLIGTEIEVSALQGSTLLWGVITLFCGLVIRFIACFCVVQGSSLNIKETLFAAIAWLPKATIQAAFGSTALDIARTKNTDPGSLTQDEIYGQQ
ncbi:UNVERIFIED_CONTAM: hypothetical protein GTU68_033929, partial [Idotea baltica]|nr:hypothetical protein [Idotea baltica]